MAEKTVILLSAGIDSPVASHLMAEVGSEVVLLHLIVNPEELSTVKKLTKRLREHHPGIEAYTADFRPIHRAINEGISSHFNCIVCKRMMYRSADILSDRIDADMISTGESLGQVASQTLSNLYTLDRVVDRTIARPLIGLDKNEVIEIAREIGTYELSIESDFKCPIVPSGPRIKSYPEEVEKEEKKIDVRNLIDDMEFNEM
ncbi:MAG: hypothetical protein R6U61_00055 [Thermoplasmata archaeon]